MVEPRKSQCNNSSEVNVDNQENYRRFSKKNCEECKAHEEYIQVLKNALKEVLDQNEALRSRVAELEALISQSEDELDEKNKLILQLQTTLKELQDQEAKKTELSEELLKTDPSNNN